MKKISLIFSLLIFLFCTSSYAALSTGTVFLHSASATTGNVNGSGFNPGATFGITDATTDANTANTDSPVVSSATYNFSAGDVGAYLYVKSGTSWTPGFYPIASVAANKATLNAAVGTAWQLSSVTGMYAPSTVSGCATVGTPTSGTIGVNYAGLDTAPISAVADFASVGASTTLTSATAGFTVAMVGNFFHLTTTGTGAFGLTGWYEITAFTNSTTVTTDRTTNNGTALVAGTGYVGGAGRLNALEDAFFEMIPGASMVFFKNGTYTITGNMSISSTNSTAFLGSFIIGYNTVPGDAPSGSSRPIIACGALNSIFGSSQSFLNMIFTTTTTGGVTIKDSMYVRNCKILNSSSSTGRTALFPNGGNSGILSSELICQNGYAASGSSSANTFFMGCYIHDSVRGIQSTSVNQTIVDCIIEACSTAAIELGTSTGGHFIVGNTLYGRESKMGVGLNLSSVPTPSCKFINNILYGLTTGALNTTSNIVNNLSSHNDYFNNTTDTTLWNKDSTVLAVNPNFANASQLTGTTGSGSGSVFTDLNADFTSVTDNVDFLTQISGTGATAGGYLITSHTATTLTVNNAVGTNATADRVYYVTVGHNFAIGNSPVKNGGTPTFRASGSESVSFLGVGAVQANSDAFAGSLLTQ